MNNEFRLAKTGRIERSKSLAFAFNGHRFIGFSGDTLASALLANGVHLVSRSIKYHRPRGVMTAGHEEPNALVQLERGAHTEPNLRSTEIELYEGLEAFSVNCWPSVDFDLRAVQGLGAPVLVAGFYNKTFKWPAKFWKRFYEPAIRAAAGHGVASRERDPDLYDHMHWHCDVLVVGAGPAGLSAALAAGRAGVRVVLVETEPELGGTLLSRESLIASASSSEWLSMVVRELDSLPNVLVLRRTSVFGYYDHNYFVASERRTDHLARGRLSDVARKRIWHIRARRAVLATGAYDRPLVFGNNDLPGIFLSSAGCTYANRYGVSLGKTGVAFTNNDVGFELSLATHTAACNLTHIVDLRAAPTADLLRRARDLDLEVVPGHVVAFASGGKRVRSVGVLPTGGGSLRRLACDHVLVSGGFNPAVHLFSQSPGTLRYDEQLGCFLPHRSPQSVDTAGAINACFALERALTDGANAGARALTALGYRAKTNPLEPGDDLRVEPLWSVQALLRERLPGKHFVDFQGDVTEQDVQLAAREGFRSVEHAKRYTTLGMSTDQGKTSNVTGLALLASAIGKPIAEVGTTTFRPPFVPVTFGALAGRNQGALSDPIRNTSIHVWHAEHGAVFEDVGQWRRPRFYPRSGETMEEAVLREVRAVRTTAGVMDASTLGKIDIQGPDATEFLNRVYTNAWTSLAVGACRYGLMCKPDGMAMDDGVTTRLGEHRYLMTTTTGNAGRVLDHLEEWLQTEWPELRVFCTSVTEQWATVAVAGPSSRRILQALAPTMELSAAAFPFMTYREGLVAGLAARLFRISFSGELAYEVNVPWWHGLALWNALIEVGKHHGLTPYGTEAMHVLRAEKGYIIIGQDTDGTVTPHDLGMDWIVSAKKGDFIGRRSFSRPDTSRGDRKQLVGLVPSDKNFVAPEGAHLVGEPNCASYDPQRGSSSLGHVTSSYFSPNLASGFALALIQSGRALRGKTVYCVGPSAVKPMTVTDPIFFDRAGKRRDGID